MQQFGVTEYNPYPETFLPRKIKPRHPNSERFHQLLAEIGELHDKKASDYGRSDDPLANVRASTEWGVPAWVGAMVRLTDKVRRLQSLVKNGKLNNESAGESFKDIMVYSGIAHILFEEENARPE